MTKLISAAMSHDDVIANAPLLSAVTSPDDMYYKYDDETERVQVGYPRLTATDFGGGAGGLCNESLPTGGGGRLDAVFFNATDDLLYFYQNEWVSPVCYHNECVYQTEWVN